jgi:predicted translin family RNA/ssDNA-binding protein
MLDTTFFKKIRENLLSYAEKRREVIKACGDVQHRAKRAIFCLQRDEVVEAQKILQETGETLQNLYKKHQKDSRIFDEGSYKASLEEYVEAVLFEQCLAGKKIGSIPKLTVDPEVFIGGLADVPGELLRYAIKSATERKFAIVEKCFKTAEDIIGEMITMDLTGYNRQKFDQAKQSLGKLQYIVYEISLRERGSVV